MGIEQSNGMQEDAPISRLPAIYGRATLRCVTPVDDATKHIGIAFDFGSNEKNEPFATVRLALSDECARVLVGEIKAYLDDRKREMIRLISVGKQTEEGPTPNKSKFINDNHLRDGCRMQVHLTKEGWQLQTFNPKGGLIASYARRPFGSMGLALDAWAAGKSIRSVFPEMAAAEEAYSCGSKVTL